MSKKSEYKRNHKNKQSLVYIGTGLALLAVMVVLINVFGTEKAISLPAAVEENSYSVTPSKVDFPAPVLALKRVDGGRESLLDYRDRVVLVNNWATWCPPCKAEIPTLQAYYEAHEADGFVIIGIEAGEPQQEVLEFVKSVGISYPIWLDPGNAALAAFGSGGLPNSFVIDRSGTVRLAWVGEINRSMLEKHVTPLLAEN